MKKLNIPLLIGLIIVSGIVFLILFGEYYAPHDASTGEQSIWVENENGERELKRAPLSPDKTYLLGTDSGGRDILSVIMAGAKNTFFIAFLATVLRFLLAIPIAYFAAFGEKVSKRLIVIFSTTFSAVPSLLICIMILKIDAISNLNLWPSMLAFLIVFTIVGWGRLASTMEEKISDILNQDFIQGEIAIGKSKLSIAIRNVLPHIMPTIIIHIFLEIALVLLLLAQLGVFDVFVGNKQVFTVRTVGTVSRTNFNFFPEWGAMLAATKRSIRDNRFWLSIYPLIAFSISIIGFNLLGQGLNHELNKRNSRFISYASKLWFFLSPLTFINEVKNFKKKRKVVVLKISAVILIIAGIVVPILNTVLIEDSEVMAHVIELSKDEYQGRLIGTPGHDKAADYIVSRLKEYNIEPLFNGSYTRDFNINPEQNFINDSKCVVIDDVNKALKEFKYKSDYYIEAWTSTSTEELEGELITSADFLEGKLDTSKEYLLVLSPEENQSFLYDSIQSQRSDYKHIKGVLIPDTKDMTFFSKRIVLEERGLVKILNEVEAFHEVTPPAKIIVGKRMGSVLWQLAGNKVKINAHMDKPEGLTGRNIGGIIRGKSQENPVIIATTYDYLGFHDAAANVGVEDIVKYKGLYENGTSIAGSLELGRQLENNKQKPEKSIIFLFIDASKATIAGVTDIESFGIFEQQPLLIYLKYVGITKWDREEDSIYHNTVLNGGDLSVEQEFYRWLRRNAAKSNYYIISDDYIRERSLEGLKNKNMIGIVLQGLKETEIAWHIGMEQSDMGEIDVDRMRTNIQYLLDTISDLAYGK